MRTTAIALLALLLAACAGFRGGWASVAYVGDQVPTEVTRVLPDVGVPGLKLQVGLNNVQRTYDYQVWLFALPVSVDPRNVMTQDRDGKLRVTLNVTPASPGWELRAGEARISFDGRTYVAQRATRFAQWNEAGEIVAKGGRYEHRPIPGDLRLEAGGRSYLLTLEFDAPLPPPEHARLSLDLSQALRSSGAAPLATIRFAPVRWKEGYS